jgi:hypothetical protein
LVTRHGVGNSSLFEVNADGSIRTQTWKEKLGNFGARITRNYSLRKDTKDAAVAAALERMAHDALNGPDEEVKHTVRFQEKYPADILVRFREAKQRVEQRNAPRQATVAAAPANPADQAAVASLHTQGANHPNYGATATNAPVASTSAAAPAVNLTPAQGLNALANRYGVNPRIAKFLLGGPEFGKVAQVVLKMRGIKGVNWAPPLDAQYAQALQHIYDQEAVYRDVNKITDDQIQQWAELALNQVQN